MDFRLREVRNSMENRWVLMEAKSEERESELRSMELTWELLQKTPVNKHGSIPCCQFWRMFGFGREDLKLNRFWASEAGEERESEQNRGSRERSNVVRRFILCSILFPLCSLMG